MKKLILAMVGLVLTIGGSGVARGEDVKVRRLSTPEGIEFGLIGDKSAGPAPTLFIFAGEIDRTLTDRAYNAIGMQLAKQGFLCVSLDLPCHGKDEDKKRSSELAGWRERLEAGNDLVPTFTTRCSKVLDYLIAEGYTDPTRVAAAGTSRGGFIAMHFAAADPRVRCAVGFAPVTNLMALSEFAGTNREAEARALSLSNAAGKLAGRPIWVCIGNDDGRVSTDDAIAFTRSVVRESKEKKQPPLVELHVMASRGHGVSQTLHVDAAEWVSRVLSKK